DLSMNRQLTTIPFGGIRTLARLKQLRISGTSITVIPDLAFKDLNNLEEIVLLEPQSHVEYHIGNRSFAYLPSLTKLTLNNFKLAHFPNLTGNFKLEDLYLDHNEIKVLPTNLCDILPNLFELRVSGNNLEALPKLSGCKKLAILVVDSNRIQSFGDSLNGLSSIVDISAKYNRIKSIEENDFKGLTQLDKLLLEENKISNIHKNAFSDLTNLKDLILTDNNFPELPTLGLVAVETLSIKGNSKLKKFPSPRHLPNIKILHLYYPYHCCAFLNARKGIYNNNNTTLNITLSNGDQVFSKWIWLADDLENMTSFDPEDIDSSTYEDTSQPKTSPHDEDILNKKIKCTPEPDPFFPCEDLMGDWVLRCGVWIVFVLALCGNATVIIVILASHTKMDVSRFLISNLAFADLFMGIYLGFLAVVDVSTLGNFKSYGVEWQLGPGCRTAGFLATLSSELSVFTLTVITVERYIAIKNAIRVNRKLQLKTAVIVMIFGWVFALVTATLPLLEVNTYGKFSVCLPFETDDKKSIVFLVFLLCLNAAAFIVILFCYILMYCSIRGSNAWNASDFRVAKRMALLVFTDFACWAPIVFFSLTATFGSSIINLSQAKIFTVFVFPLNSCCNPFLYAIFTSHFKKDLLAICRRVEDKYPFLKITKQRMSFSRRSSYSGAVSENPNIYLRVRRFSLPVFARGFNNSITTNGRGSDSSNSNKISLDTNPIGHDGNDHLLTERVTSV
ncbi:lutropin-choriogonadotropic hormone receptor isoform X2, partial [Paramuricea clavata]